MRKNLIAMSAATLVAGLGMAGGAAANVLLDNGVATISASDAVTQVVQPGGIGHKLLVPYFNTQSGNATLLNIVNTDGVNGKSVKVRFRGASNSDDLFDFQVYLSPNDVWTASVTTDASGTSVLSVGDRSCTIPSALTGQQFVKARLPASFTADNQSAQTREGYVEIFNVADIPPVGISTAVADFGAPLAAGTANPLFTAIKHVNGTPPCTAGTINNLAEDPASLARAYAMGFRAPTGTLFANWTIINVPKSGASTGEATALVALNGAGTSGRGNIVFSPQLGTRVNGADAGVGEPAASAALNPDLLTADPLLRTINGGATGVTNGDPGNTGFGTAARPLPRIAALRFDLPDLSTPYLSNQFVAGVLSAASPIAEAEALTRAIAATAIINEFLTDPTITANTDWVLSLPTRRYHVALDYTGATAAVPPVMAFTRMPNRDYFMNSASGGNASVTNFQICSRTNMSAAVQTLTYWDREEQTPSAAPAGFVISPGTPAPVAVFQICGENVVMRWNARAGESVLGAEIATVDVTTANGGDGRQIRDGWARLVTTGLTTGQTAGLATGNGLPILGKAFVRASNPRVSAGIAANFGGSWEHRFTRPATP